MKHYGLGCRIRNLSAIPIGRGRGLGEERGSDPIGVVGVVE